MFRTFFRRLVRPADFGFGGRYQYDSLGPAPDDKAPAKSKAPIDKEVPKCTEPEKLTEGFIRFRIQEIDKQIKVGYCVCVADVNGDGKPDIVVADVDRVVWYENPTWQRHTLVENRIKVMEGGKEVEKIQIPIDNVSIAPAVIDGKVNFVLAAGWTGRFESKEPGVLKWLRQGKSPTSPWEIIPIPCDETTVHRVKVADLSGDGHLSIVVAPLMGATAPGREIGWTVGRSKSSHIGFRPTRSRALGRRKSSTSRCMWSTIWCAVPAGGRRGSDLLVASYEGVTLVGRDDTGKWQSALAVEGDQRTPLGVRGASEIKVGTLKSTRYLATIEPWHGNQVVVYTHEGDASKKWDRKVLDKNLRRGHAVWCADLDGDGADELIVGVGEDPMGTDQFVERRGVRIYRSLDPAGKRWEALRLDEGGVAVEDLTVADLNGDGRPDIIAVGRQTGNVKIYWNVR